MYCASCHLFIQFKCTQVAQFGGRTQNQRRNSINFSRKRDLLLIYGFHVDIMRGTFRLEIFVCVHTCTQPFYKQTREVISVERNRILSQSSSTSHRVKPCEILIRMKRVSLIFSKCFDFNNKSADSDCEAYQIDSNNTNTLRCNQ